MDNPGNVGHVAIAEAHGCVEGRQVGDDAVGRLRRRRVAELGLGSQDDHPAFFFFLSWLWGLSSSIMSTGNIQDEDLSIPRACEVVGRLPNTR